MLQYVGTPKPYRNVYEHDLGHVLPEKDNSFAAVTCFGSLGPGHAPAKCMDEFIRITQPGGYVVFNTRAETYPEQELKQKVDNLTEKGAYQITGYATASSRVSDFTGIPTTESDPRGYLFANGRFQFATYT